MCIIVYKPQGKSIERDILETCFINNPDGAGFMYPCEGRLLIQKGYFEFDDFLAAWDKCRKIHGDSLPVVFHFRIATAGVIDKRNCHPHRITPDLGFVHNGILSCVTVPKDSKLSDTIIYRERHLGKLAGHSLNNSALFEAIGLHIGSGNKFAFMNGKGKTLICNEDQGVWKDGLWFSNHSFLLRRMIPFTSQFGEWYCEYCGKELMSMDELAEGACFDCLDYYDFDSMECGGCHEPLFSSVHKELGWCDDCGSEIYGRKWAIMLREAATPWETRNILGCF